VNDRREAGEADAPLAHELIGEAGFVVAELLVMPETEVRIVPELLAKALPSAIELFHGGGVGVGIVHAIRDGGQRRHRGQAGGGDVTARAVPGH
jgi:hypothetical protein